MFIDQYLAVCEANGVSPTTVLKQLDISMSVFANWKKGGEPTNPTKQKIAEYFGITVNELLGNKKEPATIKSDELSEDEIRFLSIVRQLPPDKRGLVEILAVSLRNTQ